MPLATVPLATVLREWGRIGCIGFGGPPAHIGLLRQLCVERRGWLDAREFEDALAVCNLLPGPASTQLAIFCAWRLRGRRGALVGGAGFILPGLVVILALAVLFLGSPPLWVLGAGAGAGAAVPAVAVHAGWSLLRPSWRNRARRASRWLAYLAAGLAAAATDRRVAGARAARLRRGRAPARTLHRAKRCGDGVARRWPAPATRSPRVAALALAGRGGGVLASVAWVAFKVGALSFGGGFVIIPLMQADAVSHYHWMTGAQFLNAVALGQITPGPVVQTVAVVGYAAAGHRRRAARLGRRVRAVVRFIVLFGGPPLRADPRQASGARLPRRRRARRDRRDPRLGDHPGPGTARIPGSTRCWPGRLIAAAAAAPRRGARPCCRRGAVGVVVALAAGTVSP